MSETMSSVDRNIPEIVVDRHQELKLSFLKNREMYDVDKFCPVTEEDIERYIKSNKELIKVLPRCIATYLSSNDWGDKATGANMISQLPPEVQDKFRTRMTGLVEKGLVADDIFTKAYAASMISYVSVEAQGGLREKLPSVIKTGLESPYQGIYETALGIIEHALFESQVDLIKMGLNKPVLRVNAAKMISKIPTEIQGELRQIVSNFVRADLGKKDWVFRYSCLRMIPYTLIEDQAEFIKTCYDDSDQQGRSNIRHMFPQFEFKDVTKEDVAQKLEGDEQDLTELRTLATRTPLYDKSTGRFVHQPFEKDHSSTTLFDKVPGQSDNTLRDRLIMRTIVAHTYFAWKKAYEASDFWKSRGFDYVPVEPIVKVKSTGSYRVDVFTGILKGPSIGMWKEKTKLFNPTIHEQMYKIIACLEELGVNHRDTNLGNFIVYFSRNKNGEVDITKPPRVYIIDFDKAESVG